MGSNGRKLIYTTEERRARHLAKGTFSYRAKKAMTIAKRAFSSHDWGNLVGDQDVHFSVSEVEDMIEALEAIDGLL